MAGYIGPIPVPQATQNRETFTATASQTSFATGGYQAGYLDVFMNGVKLVDGSDYTATNGSDVVLATGAAVNDIIEVVSYSAFEVLNQNFTGTTVVDDLTVGGNLTVTGTVDGVDIAARDAVLTSTTTTANAALPSSGGAVTGNVTFGDNDKAIFGAGSDLEIYHDGNSKIADVGGGKLELHSDGTGVFIQKGATEYMAQFLTDGAVELYYDNAKKFETTSTGVDIASVGTAGASGTNFIIQQNNSGGVIQLKNHDSTEDIEFGQDYFRIKQGGAERLRIDTSGNLIKTGGGLISSNGTSDTLVISGSNAVNTGGNITLEGNTASDVSQIKFKNGSTEAMRIAGGNVGVNVTSPSTPLHVDCGAPSSSDKTIATFQSQAARQIGFVWDDSASTMGIATLTNHSMTFHTNGNSNERMRIDASGRVTKPYQPSFRVQGTGAWTSYLAADTYHKLALTNNIFNVGSNYSNTTYDFTAPVSGKYLFIISMYAQHGGGQDDDNQHWTARFGKNGGVISQPHIMEGYTNQGDNDTTATMTSLIDVSINDTIQIYIRGHSGATVRYYAPACCFSGYLVG